MKFKFLEHTADIKFQAFGGSLEEVFENSALAVKKIMFDGKVKEKIKKEIKIKGRDNERLMYEFLEELLILLDSEDFILSDIKKIEIKNNVLEAEIIGDKASDYDFNNDVKAVTYNDMFIKKQNNEWVSQVVLDV